MTFSEKSCVEVFWAKRGLKWAQNKFFKVTLKFNAWSLNFYFLLEVTVA